MALPGPPGALWAVALLIAAGAAVVIGEPIRLAAARWAPLWDSPSLLERLLLDFYLGGAVLYAVAAFPFGLFTPAVALGIPVVAAVALLGMVYRARRRAGAGAATVRALSELARPAVLVTGLSALALYVFELALALPIGTGNTFDSGLLTTYTALLLQHHSIPLSFQPYATTSILYPQGTTVWLGWAQIAFGLPPARTSLLVTPLFFALAPIGAYAFGRRWFGNDRAGVAFALTIAGLAPATRGIVGGSNDFVFAFPLVLLLAGQVSSWTRSAPLALGDAVAFGVLTGYSAALNPVGAQWLIVTVLVAPVAWGRAAISAPLVRLGRWAVAALASLIAVLPSLYILTMGRASPGFVPGASAAPAGTPTGITAAQFLGAIDPFLFRPTDLALSTIPLLRAELAGLLVVGVVLLVLVRGDSAVGRYWGPFRGFAMIGGIVLVGLLAILWAASSGAPPFTTVADVTSEGELSMLLFTLYVFVASLPLVLAFERFFGWVGRRSPDPPAPPAALRGRPARPRVAFDPARALAPLAVALLILAPGLALTPSVLGPSLTTVYHRLGNVTSDDLDLLGYAGAHLPAGARVLVAPGSAADFLPGYDADVVLLYPLIPGFSWTNVSYNRIVDELSNATLDAQGVAAMAALDVGYIIVTGNSTTLWPAFSAAPLLADPSAFPLLQHYGDAYLFARAVVP